MLASVNIEGIDQFFWVAVVGIVLIATVTALAPRVGVAGPLVLVVVGLGLGLLQFAHDLQLDPDWILIGILPPLLYAAAVSLPTMEFRRDFGAIGGLSVILVLLSSLVLGVFFSLVIPGVGLALGIALGAVLSPTDAVATSIVKKLGISPRVVTVLEGESLLNDATALVLLRTAVAAIAGSFSLWGSIGAFTWAVLLAVLIGGVVGYINLRIRARIPNTAAATAMGFVVPYVAYLPTEHFGGSGLVAAVVAGIVTGQGAARHFTAEQRLSDRVNWHTVELVLEGAVFLIMGLEITTIVNGAPEKFGALGHAGLLALGAFAIILTMRALYVAPLIALQAHRARRAERLRPRLEHLNDRMREVAPAQLAPRIRGRRDPEARMSRFRTRVTRSLADIAYLESSPFGWREGTVIVWAGMRGAVTLAAAQTLPQGENRSLLILVAFLVAVGTLLLQGSTIGPLTRALGLARSAENDPAGDQLAELNQLMRAAASAALEDPALARSDGTPFDPEALRAANRRLTAPPDEENGGSRMQEFRELRLVSIQAQRERLAAARADGHFGTAVLRSVLEALDAEELGIRARLERD